MSTDTVTNPPASAGAAGVNGTNPPGYETGAAGVLGADQGQPGQSDGGLPEGADGEQVPEFDEIEHEGLKHQIPKALRPFFDKGLDYTRKTQEHADAVRAAEQQFAQREQHFAQQQQAAQVLNQARAGIAALDMELQKYQGVNWQAANAQDPTATNAAWMQFQQLKDQRAQVAQQLQAAEQQFHTRAAQEAQQRVHSVVSKWTPDELQAVSEIGSQVYGITPQHMALFGSNPMLLTILRDAVLHQKAARTAAAVTKAPAAPPAQPAAQLPQGGRSQAPKSMNDPTLSTDDWMRRRTEQLRKRGSR